MVARVKKKQSTMLWVSRFQKTHWQLVEFYERVLKGHPGRGGVAKALAATEAEFGKEHRTLQKILADPRRKIIARVAASDREFERKLSKVQAFVHAQFSAEEMEALGSVPWVFILQLARERAEARATNSGKNPG